MISTLKKVALAVVLSLSAVAANATPNDWLEHDPILEFEQVRLYVPGPFQDTFAFYITQAAMIDTSVVGAHNNPPLAITGGQYSLFSNPDGNVGNGDDVNLLGTGVFWTFDGSTGQTGNSIGITAGNYYFMVTGNAGSPSGGAYDISSTIAIPEPETYAMLLAGLGLMGFVARRRRGVQAAA